MINPRITAGSVLPLDRPDSSDVLVAGLFRGKEIKKSTLRADADFGIYAEEEPGKSASSKKASLKANVQKQEKETFSEQEEDLPDFEEFAGSPDFQRFMAQMRRSQRSGSYAEIREALEENFEDPTLKNAALVVAIKLLDKQEGDPDLKKLLQQVLQELVESNGPEIRAGYNVSNIAASTVSSDAELVAALRDFYCQVIFGDQNLVNTYYYIMKSFPDKIERAKRDQERRNQKNAYADELDGPEGQKRLEKALEFLLKSLAAELKSNAPSLEAPLLKSVMDGICQMEFLRNSYRSFLQLLTKMNAQCSVIPVAPSRLIKEILGRVTREAMSHDEFLRVAAEFGVPPLQLSIEFLTRIYDMVRLFPERVFPNAKNREVFLTAVQHALDSAIARESEVAE